MDRLIFHNDRIVSLEEARLSPGQAGLLVGWGVFTTLRVYQGVPFAFQRHWARLVRDAARLGVPIPYQQESVRQVTIELGRANHQPECMARVSLVKNAGGLWSEPSGHPATDLLIFTRAIVPWPVAHRLRLVRGGIVSNGPFSGTKILSWVSHASELEKSHAEGFDDALLVNEKGHLAECTSANFFLVRDGEVFTPPLSSGCLPGITREILLEIAPSAGVELHEQDLTEQDLHMADEVFISSTTREVAAVEFISPQWKYPAPGKVTHTLDLLFKNYIQSYLGRPGKSGGESSR